MIVLPTEQALIVWHEATVREISVLLSTGRRRKSMLMLQRGMYRGFSVHEAQKNIQTITDALDLVTQTELYDLHDYKVVLWFYDAEEHGLTLLCLSAERIKT